MKATIPEPEIVTRNGKPVSVIMRSWTSKEDALKNGVAEKWKECVEVYAKA